MQTRTLDSIAFVLGTTIDGDEVAKLARELGPPAVEELDPADFMDMLGEDDKVEEMSIGSMIWQREGIELSYRVDRLVDGIVAPSEPGETCAFAPPAPLAWDTSRAEARARLGEPAADFESDEWLSDHYLRAGYRLEVRYATDGARIVQVLLHPDSEPVPVRPAPSLVPVFMPSLASLLLAAEERKGRPLTRADVLEIRDGAICTMMAADEAEELARRRGYVDLDPESAWEAWQQRRAGT